MSSTRNTVIRSLHDVGAAAWFGGALMGAVAVNGAANDVSNPWERATIAADGWARWAPVNAAAIGAHLFGGAGLVLANRHRVAAQSGVTANTTIKAVATGLALASTAYSGVLGAKIGKAAPSDAAGGVKPSADTSTEVATPQRQLRILQWVTPVLTAVIIVLRAQQGEQQRPAEQARGVSDKLRRRASS